jgi:hypothetical protein
MTQDDDKLVDLQQHRDAKQVRDEDELSNLIRPVLLDFYERKGGGRNAISAIVGTLILEAVAWGTEVRAQFTALSLLKRMAWWIDEMAGNDEMVPGRKETISDKYAEQLTNDLPIKLVDGLSEFETYAEAR